MYKVCASGALRVEHLTRCGSRLSWHDNGPFNGLVTEAVLCELAACLWDLRTQCEQQLRALTDAQRLLEDHRLVPFDPDLKARMMRDVLQVSAASNVIAQAAADCATIVERLSPVEKP